MTPSRAAATASLLLAATLPLAACGDDGSEAAAESSPEIDASRDTSPTDEATESTDKDEPEAIPTTYPEVDLEYADFPELTEKTRAALEVFVEFDRGRLQLLREAAMNDLVRDNAAESVVTQWQGTVDYLQDNNAYYRGETVTTFTDVATKDNFVAIDLCIDGSALRYVEDGQAGPVGGPTRVPFRAVVTRTDTGWTVTESGTQEGSC